MKGSAHLEAKLGIIKVQSGVDIKIGNYEFDIQISLKSINGKPNIKVERIHVRIYLKYVVIKLTGGGIFKNIINLVIEFLKKTIVKFAAEGLLKQLRPLINSEVNKLLNRLPSDIQITPSIYMKYSFPYDPNVHKDLNPEIIDTFSVLA